MNLAELVERLDLRVYSGREELARAVGGGYAGDLLSDVIAHGRKDHVWVTIQIHPNIIAVAVLKELAAIVLANGREPAAETVAQARKGARAHPRDDAPRVRIRRKTSRARDPGRLISWRSGGSGPTSTSIPASRPAAASISIPAGSSSGPSRPGWTSSP